MIAAPRHCFSPTELAEVIGGRLKAADFDSALSHLDNCDDCRAAIESIDQHEPWIVHSLADQAVDPLHAETACQVALWQMLQTPSAAPELNAAPGLLAAPPCQQLGPYVLLRTLGAGGMGTVYLARHDRLKRKCAVKLLPRERVDQPGWLERFDREMTAVANLEHPHVVRATDAGHQDGWHYLVMEYLDGLDVGRVANRLGKIEIADACEIIRQAALGLQHIHQSDLVHRDIKPSNLMLCRDGQIKILDLGLVLAGDDPLSKDDRLTTVGHLMGTMPYMAPEQLADSREVDTRADIYSLGATLFRLIVGRPPHKRHRSLASHILAITQEDAPALDSLRDDLDPKLVALVAQMLARDPLARPASAADVAEHLKAFSQGSRLKGLLRQALRRPGDETQSHSLMPSATMQQPPSANGPRRWLMGAAAAACLLIAGMVFKIQTDKGTLVIHSEQADLTVVVKQEDEVVQRLTITPAGDQRTVLRKGTYRIEIEGGGEPLKLSEDVVTIGRGDETNVSVLSSKRDSVTARLFQGESLAHWMSILRREEDVNAIGLAMDAVEKLTRELDGKIDPESRRAAAILSADRARKLGGIVTSGLGMNFGANNQFDSEDPSSRFVAYFNEVFPKYYAQPGLEVLDRELTEGTTQSKASMIWALNNYIAGVSSSSVSIQDRRRAKPELHSLSRTPEGKQLCNSILDRLRALDDSIPDSFNGKGSVIRLANGSLYAMGMAINDSIVGIDWLEEMTRDRMNEYAEQWAKAKVKQTGIVGTDMSGGAFGVTFPDSDLLMGAIQIAGADPDSNWWDYLAATCLSSQLDYHADEQGPEVILRLIAKNAPDTFIESIAATLKGFDAISVSIDQSIGDSYNGFGGMPGGGSGYGAASTPVTALVGDSRTWNFALEYFAAEKSKYAEEAEAALELLTKIRSEMKRHQVEKIRWNQKQPYANIDRAIQTVRAGTK